MFVLHQYPIYRWARGIAVMGVVRGGIWRRSCNPAHPAWGGSSGGRAIVGARRVLEITAESVLGGLGHYGTTSQGRSLATRPPHGQQTASRAMKSLMEDDPDWQELGECTLPGVALESGSLAAPAKRLRSEEQVLRNRAIQAAYRARKKVGRIAAQPCTLVGGLARAGCCRSQGRLSLCRPQRQGHRCHCRSCHPAAVDATPAGCWACAAGEGRQPGVAAPGGM